MAIIYKCHFYAFQKYTICVTRKQLPRHAKITDTAIALQYEDPVSLSTLYRPITVRNSDPRHTFSAPIIDELTKTSKFDPISGTPLVGDWRVEDFDLDKKMSSVTACIPLTYGGRASAVVPCAVKQFKEDRIVLHKMPLTVIMKSFLSNVKKRSFKLNWTRFSINHTFLDLLKK